MDLLILVLLLYLAYDNITSVMLAVPFSQWGWVQYLSIPLNIAFITLAVLRGIRIYKKSKKRNQSEASATDAGKTPHERADEPDDIMQEEKDDSASPRELEEEDKP